MTITMDNIEPAFSHFPLVSVSNYSAVGKKIRLESAIFRYKLKSEQEMNYLTETESMLELNRTRNYQKGK